MSLDSHRPTEAEEVTEPQVVHEVRCDISFVLATKSSKVVAAKEVSPR